MMKKIEKLNPYWFWENGLSNELCDLLLNDRAKLEESDARVGGSIQSTKDASLRKTKICWAPKNHWIEGILYNFGLYAL